MGCAVINSHKWVNSKNFEHSAVKDAADARGVSMVKMYRLFPRLLESKRHNKPIDVLTQYEVSSYLEFPMEFFYHKEGQKQPMFVCGSGIMCCAFCEQIADFRCDYPIGNGRTCDLPMCREHKTHRPDIGVDIDYCPHHQIPEQVKV